MIRKISLLVVLSFLIASGLSAARQVARESLVGYWPFDEGGGDKVKDESGNGNDGKIVKSGEYPKWVQGKFGTALDFGGNGSYVAVPDSKSLDLTKSVTYMAWFKLNEPIQGQRRMMSKNNSIFFLFDFGNPTSLDFLVKPNNDFVESKTVDWKIGEWYHVAGTYDGDALRIYINGKLEGERKGVPEIAPSDLELWIGADDWRLPTTSFPGVIDEVRIYDRALSEEEINQAMEGPTAVGLKDKLPLMWGSLRR
ncbi:TPA: LamG domain-containing protein [Candidatus Poribacteria bacterium]|nr:LamG domain-containing protein [Candidatus Poribacteria bacterium]